MTVYRLSKKDYAAQAYSGEGGRFSAGRWNILGTLITYASSSRPLALLEILVRLKANELRRINDLYVMCPAELPPDLSILVVQESQLPRDWRAVLPSSSTQRLGAAWMRAGRFGAVSVPSTLLPSEINYLINPKHPEFEGIRVLPAEPLSIDTRILGKLR